MADKQAQHRAFREIYDQLNEGQRQAVDTIEGPVMVIAGPGTGKTQILGARIGKILLETDTRPENILCLTYTDAGVVAMRRRLLKMIGPDAYRVNIATFHAFCNQVIQENLSSFEKTRLDPVSELEKIDLLRKLIDSFKKDHPLKRYRGDVYYEVRNLDSLFRDMKREGWTPEFIEKKIDDYLESLPQRDSYIAKRASGDFRKGDVRTDKIAIERERMEKLRAAVREFPRFQQMMQERGRYDFDDMINWVIRAFEEDRDLLLRYQEQYLYILVDEYQDTSGTQNRLISLLTGYWDTPNVFVVGDDDQSIFRFQGANVENMYGFAETYSRDLVKVLLTGNYRSTQSILDLSGSLISANTERLVNRLPGLSKELKAAHPSVSLQDFPPLITEYETPRAEMAGIVLQVRKLIGSGVEPSAIAVIFKENKYGEELAGYLRELAIPYYSKRSLNLLDTPLVQQVLRVFEYLDAELDTPGGGDEMLFEILHASWWEIPPSEIARLSIEASQRRGEQSTTLRLLLEEKSRQPAPDLFSASLHPRVAYAVKSLESLLASVGNVTLQQLFEKLLQSGVLKHSMQQEDRIRRIQMLTGLFDLVKEETQRDPSISLHGLMLTIGLMQKEGISVPLADTSGNERGVNLLTAHGSKGLEFDHVFFAGCNASVWEKKRSSRAGYAFPDTLFGTIEGSDVSGEEELRRLFYVAMTRAALHLHISFARYRNDAKPLEPSLFIAEIADRGAIQITRGEVSDEEMMEFQLLALAPQAPEIEKLDRAFVSRLLEHFVMNVTALNNFLKCPLEFYFKNLLRIPSPKNESTEFGSAIHYALEQQFRKMLADQNAFPGKEVLLSDFSWYMRRHRESFTKEQFDRRMEQGSIVLPAYFDDHLNSWNTIVTVERHIRNVVVEGVPLKGKLDKLEFDGKLVNIVDYKTGDAEKAVSKLKPPNDKEPNGGDYWRQAVFYKLLVDNHEQRGWRAMSVEFDFVEADKKQRFQRPKVFVTPEDEGVVRAQIRDTWDKIQAQEFYTGCGKPDCHWCGFVKTNEMAVALHDLPGEEE